MTDGESRCGQCCPVFVAVNDSIPGQMRECVEAQKRSSWIVFDGLLTEESEVDLQPAASGSCIEMKAALLPPHP